MKFKIKKIKGKDFNEWMAFTGLRYDANCGGVFLGTDVNDVVFDTPMFFKTYKKILSRVSYKIFE